MDDFNFESVGGVAVVCGDGETLYNFGVMGQLGIEGPTIASNAPDLYDVAPNIQGRWDGKTSICCHDAARKVLGNPLAAQMQPRGTCGGRTGKRAGEHLQTILIGAGRQAKFHKVSHAWLYALARMEYGMLGSGDGVPNGSIPAVMAKYGLLHADESGDTLDYGDGSDDLAAKWGGRNGPPKDMFQLAADNKVDTNIVRVRSFQELADGYAAGGVGLVSSLRGFTMTRNAKGICGAKGQWAHYMTGSGITVIDGRAYGVIDQSWGENVPNGPKVEDGRWPDYSFAGDRDVIEEDMIKRGAFHLIFGFSLWDESKYIDWRDI